MPLSMNEITEIKELSVSLPAKSRNRIEEILGHAGWPATIKHAAQAALNPKPKKAAKAKAAKAPKAKAAKPKKAAPKSKGKTREGKLTVTDTPV